MAFTQKELEFLSKLEDRAIAAIMKTDWSGIPISEEEKQVIGMAVSWTYSTLKAENGLAEIS